MPVCSRLSGAVHSVSCFQRVVITEVSHFVGVLLRLPDRSSSSHLLSITRDQRYASPASQSLTTFSDADRPFSIKGWCGSVTRLRISQVMSLSSYHLLYPAIQRTHQRYGVYYNNTIVIFRKILPLARGSFPIDIMKGGGPLGHSVPVSVSVLIVADLAL